MKIKDLGEFGLIDRIRSRVTRNTLSAPTSVGARPRPDINRSGHVTRGLIGIGDDTAVIPISRGKCLLWTTDILIEGVHFLARLPSYVALAGRTSYGFMLGWKVMAVNMSDIASMGGKPKYALVTLGLTGKEDVGFIDDLYRGMNAAGQGLSHPDGHREGLSHCSKGVQVIGGDISKSDSLIIDTTVIGEVEKKNLLLRKGARPGDMICVTGSCGDSAAGFELLKKTVHRASCIVHRQNHEYLIKRHLMPSPRVKEAGIIAKNKLATAMIDSSDGLLASVGFICQESGTGAKIHEDMIPVSEQLIRRTSYVVSRKLVLTGGEDYELVFTVPPAKLKKVLALVPRLTGTPVTAVGEIIKDKSLFIIDNKGRKRTAKNLGFSHF
ncbi:thiamine-phosphate kinase [Candidatus Desantisbacteria bacterium CG_4_10_14_0_8_um_filter_48_22]|uniref:Thiamine-monophosphate kinase n=1 Tax=Candidatus Desantisbacteria bacterium CG_4_10_14_0_8_um_filter_48_22 TaxID=1974543 RepID=A0A2M7S5J1_9BACT|nr:MAG: thiamine-phosphate kinase [Candidatus Desantisbacteria bacterium CG1_02_49_89]PIV55277.1 MAG: thiamine-phosphate kinase [Candidatus Desantisbacteria bacterium CG02_land_8_20_14_3_00_49_13]PIZ14648.1 MAG: thiamine-phosphate kinase [Candidatus Desantisbacteria bacterium CG_4_10_14_0_8_um_filter_48_22]